MSPRTMKAIQIHEHGGPEVLSYDEVPVPDPGPGEVLVRVCAAGINPPDWYVRDGMTILPPEFRPKFDLPLTPGTDISGVVEAVGADVRDVSVGEEVFGMLRFPDLGANAYAEYVVSPVSDLARKPATLDHIQAAGAPMSGLTAWQFLIDVGHDAPPFLQPEPHRPVTIDGNTTVLVNGAAGGVGHFALQLAKWKGARVIAVASGAHKEFLRELGADEFIDYTTHRAEDVVGEGDVDLVVDAVGGPETARFLPMLRRGGALFPIYLGFVDEEEKTKRGVTVSNNQVRSNGAQLAEIGKMLDAGTLRVAIDSTFPLADAAAAHERAARGHIQSKIVLTVADE